MINIFKYAFFDYKKLHILEIFMITLVFDILYITHQYIKENILKSVFLKVNLFLEFLIKILPIYLMIFYNRYMVQIFSIICIFLLLFIFIGKFLFKNDYIKNKVNISHTHINIFNSGMGKKQYTTNEYEYFGNLSDKNISKDIKKNNNFDFYISDISRFKLVVLVVICVFLSDFNKIKFYVTNYTTGQIKQKSFNFYNSYKFGKSMRFPLLKLMDFGVACFTINAGFIYSILSKKRLFKSFLISFLLGIIRLFMVVYEHNKTKRDVDFKYGINYNDMEFGMHLNLLLILSIITLLFILLHDKLQENHVICGFCGFCMVILHDLLLKFFLKEKINSINDLDRYEILFSEENYLIPSFFKNNDRNMVKMFFTKLCNLIYVNIEGVSFILPIFGTMLFFYSIGVEYFKSKRMIKNPSINNTCKNGILTFYMSLYKPTSILMSLMCISYLISTLYANPHRRMHNLAFISTISFIVIFNSLISSLTDSIYHKYVKNTLSYTSNEYSYVLCSRSLIKALVFSNILITVNKKYFLPLVSNVFYVHLLNICYLIFMLYLLPQFNIIKNIIKVFYYIKRVILYKHTAKTKEQTIDLYKNV